MLARVLSTTSKPLFIQLSRAGISCTTPSEYTLIIKQEEVLGFCIRCLTKLGAAKNNSDALAQVLVAGDYRGHYSHGLNRLELYVQDIERGLCDPNEKATVEKESSATALINAHNQLGPVVGNFAMRIAIQKARKTGIAWVAVRGSNHFGIAGWYSLMAASKGMIGLSITNTLPIVYPTRSCQRAIGTNPISVAAPCLKPGDEFVLDMATSAVSLGKLEMSRRRGHSIPRGWAADGTGESTSDPEAAINHGALLPLGGEEHTSGYKGYGLGMMVEVLCGILSGSDYGINIPNWVSSDRPMNLGHGFLAIDPSFFTPNFAERMSDYVETMRSLPRIDRQSLVQIPGDPERKHMRECDRLGGIPYPPVLVESMDLKIIGFVANNHLHPHMCAYKRLFDHFRLPWGNRYV